MKNLVWIFFFCYFTALAQPGKQGINFNLLEICKGLTSPVAMDFAPDGSNRLFICEQKGIIKIVKNGSLLNTPFLDITKRTDKLNFAYSEKGLLGIAFHPEYKINRRYFIYYSAPTSQSGMDHDGVLAEYKASPNPDISSTQEKIILRIPQPEGNHNGGQIAFGPDGYLYLGLGDGGGGGDKHGQNGNAQDINSLLGKILRIDINTGDAYSIPKDNPYVGKDGRDEIWAIGLRNPWKFSFEEITGRIFCADVGQNKWEEVNIIKKAGNYGWRIMEGFHCFNPEKDCNMSGLEMPIHEYNRATGISAIGGFMYRGKNYPSLHGAYIFGDWSGKIYYLREDVPGEWTRYDPMINAEKTNDLNQKINSFGRDADGNIYLLIQKLYGPFSKTGSLVKITL